MSKYDKDLSRIFSLLRETKDETKEWREGIESRLDSMEKKVYLWKVYIKVAKGIATLLLLLVTLKFGNIGTMLKGIF